MLRLFVLIYFFFFFNDTATTEIYTLSLHDALPIFRQRDRRDGDDRGRRTERDVAAAHPSGAPRAQQRRALRRLRSREDRDRKSTRLNSSHANISYAVFCLKKKKQQLLSPHTKSNYR